MTLLESLGVIVVASSLTLMFILLIVLIVVVKGFSAVIRAVEARPEAAAAPVPVPVTVSAAPTVRQVPAAGSQGDINLYGVDDKTAAMLMAIVADELREPLNQLRFRSIRERKV
jgi:Na+-transporting methylmalonyl-CoA/oxaloacetate decarboxylase gamma subunit